MSIDRLAVDDRLGNAGAHFFKSGNILRNPKCNSLNLASLLPKRGLYNTNLEYDLWYSIGGDKQIHGYVYTDALEDYLYIKPANQYFAEMAMYASVKLEPTGYGEKLVDQMGKGIEDKYRLRRSSAKHRFVIFLPGTNCIKKVFDWDKAKAAVDQGAVIKPHPISSASLLVHLRNLYGEDNVLNRKESGHELMRAADIVGCCWNSEMGLAAIAAGKGFHLFTDLKSKSHGTYHPIYKAILSGGNYRDNLIRVFDSPFSGMIYGKSDDALDRIASFFNQFSEVPHIEPKNTSP